MQRNQIDMLQGPLLGKILLFALPLAASSFLQQLFNSADQIVVGRFVSSQALAAVGSNGAIINLLINLFVGLSVGANVLIARLIGSGKKERIKSAVHTVMLLALVSGVFLAFFGCLLARPILEMIACPDDVIDLSECYLRIYFCGMPFIMLFNFGSAVLRSKGDSKRPLYSLFLGGVLNVALNLVLVLGFNLSVAGVAIATVASNMVSSFMIVRFLMGEEEPFRFSFKELAIDRSHLKSVLAIGIPAGFQSMLFSLSNVVIQGSINSYGSAAIAGNAAALTYEHISYFFVNAFSQACMTFTSQNYGAGSRERCDKTLRISLSCSMVFMLVLDLTVIFFHRPLLLIFTTDEEVLAYGYIRFYHVLALHLLNCTYEMPASAMRGVGYSLLPTLVTVFGTCAFRILWVSTIFKMSHTMETLLDVYPVSWIITGASMFIAYALVHRRVFGKRLG